MANRLDRAAELFRAMSHPRGETLVRLAQNNPDLARQLDEAVATFEATGSQRPLLALLSQTTGLTDLPRARMAAISDAPPAKPNTDDVQRRMVGAELGPIGDLPMPAVSRALDDIVEAGGGDNFIDRLASYTVRPQYSLDLLPNNRPLFSADTGLGGGGSSMDVMPGAGIPSSGGGLIVQGGRGVPVGGPTGSGVVVPQSTALSTQVTPRTALPGRGPRRLETTAGVPQGAVEPRRATAADATTRPAPRLESPDVVAERRAMEGLEDAVDADAAGARAARAEANRPGAAAERARKRASDIVRATAIPVAAGAAGVVLNSMRGPSMTESEGAPDAPANLVPDITRRPEAYSAPRPAVPDVTRPPRAFSTADLAAETSPPPRVEAPITLDYAQMARDKIRQANEIQLREGRVTPESAALSREADALYQKAADARREGFHPPIMPVEMQNEQTSAIRARQRRAG